MTRFQYADNRTMNHFTSAATMSRSSSACCASSASMQHIVLSMGAIFMASIIICALVLRISQFGLIRISLISLVIIGVLAYLKSPIPWMTA